MPVKSNRAPYFSEVFSEKHLSRTDFSRNRFKSREIFTEFSKNPSNPRISRELIKLLQESGRLRGNEASKALGVSEEAVGRPGSVRPQLGLLQTHRCYFGACSSSNIIKMRYFYTFGLGSNLLIYGLIRLSRHATGASSLFDPPLEPPQPD